MPIFYFLRSITELFNGDYFTIDGADVGEVGKSLSEALKVRIYHSIEQSSKCFYPETISCYARKDFCNSFIMKSHMNQRKGDATQTKSSIAIK